MPQSPLPLPERSITDLRRSDNKGRVLPWLFLLCGLALLAACSGGKASPEDRYLRAVHVLRSFGGPAAAEDENIPARIIYSDETNSLLHHRDKIFVLGHIAGDLAASRQISPRAALYEAYALLALGRRQEAATLLAAYVVENEYRLDHYALLCQNLYALGDWPTLLLICYEWRERDPQCSEERCRLTVAALFNLGRFAEAGRYIGEQKSCLGWQAVVYQARCLSAMNDEAGAQALVKAAERDFPVQSSQVRRLWGMLGAREKL